METDVEKAAEGEGEGAEKENAEEDDVDEEEEADEEADPSSIQLAWEILEVRFRFGMFDH